MSFSSRSPCWHSRQRHTFIILLMLLDNSIDELKEEHRKKSSCDSLPMTPKTHDSVKLWTRRLFLPKTVTGTQDKCQMLIISFRTETIRIPHAHTSLHINKTTKKKLHLHKHHIWISWRHNNNLQQLQHVQLKIMSFWLISSSVTPGFRSNDNDNGSPFD